MGGCWFVSKMEETRLIFSCFSSCLHAILSACPHGFMAPQRTGNKFNFYKSWPYIGVVKLHADIHEFNKESQQWEKSTTIPPMPTARCVAAVATWTTPEASALIVCWYIVLTRVLSIEDLPYNLTVVAINPDNESLRSSAAIHISSLKPVHWLLPSLLQ